MQIYIVTHKAFEQPEIDGYIPIQAGSLQSSVDLGYLRDDTGDNISKKNDTYCELTAQYWIWKNREKTEYVGMCHYRRYFSKKGFSSSFRYFLKEQDVRAALERHDIILPEKFHMKVTIEDKYSLTGAGFQRDLDLLEELIRSEYQEFYSAYLQVMKGHEQYFWNMFVMPAQLFDEYSDWLFEILEKMEQRVDLTGYNDRQRRIFGYLAERLLNVWVVYRKLRIYECPVVQTDRGQGQLIRTYIGQRLSIAKD